VANEPQSADQRRDLALWVVAFFLALWALLTHTHINSWNEYSRLAAVEALVERGTWVIDDTALGQLTGDRVLLNSHFYSDKPPVFTFAASGVYAVLHRGFGLSFDPQDCDPRAVTCYCFAFQCPRPFDWAFYWLTLVMVGVPSALMLALFYRGTGFFGLANLPALILTGVLGLGTLILPYSLVFTNHVPTAACLFAGLCALVLARFQNVGRWLFAAGFLTSLAVALEFQAGPFLAIFFIAALWRHRRSTWPFVLGALLPLALTAALDWWMLGDLLPPQLHTAGYNYPGSALYGTAGGTHGSANLPEYAFRILLGDHGVFAFTPVMLWAIYALAVRLFQREYRLRGEAFAAGAASLLVALYIIFFTDNFGGQAYGPRWFIAVTPVLFFFAAGPALYRTAWRWLIFAILSALSLFAAWQGASNPWGPALPPLRLETSASSLAWPAPLTPRQVAAIPHRLDVSFSGSPVQLMGYALTEDTVRPGVPLTVTLYWQALAPTVDRNSIFVHLVNSIGALSAQHDRSPSLGDIPTSQWKPGDVYADAHRLELSETAYAPDDALVQVGLYRPNGMRLVARDAKGQSLGDAVQLASLKLLPRPGDLPNPVRVNFGDKVALAGYNVNTRVIRPGGTISVTLYWQALAPMQLDYSVFMHLTSTNGEISVKNDSLPYTSPKRTQRWTVGQVMKEVRALVIPDYVLPGLYAIDMGIFSMDTGDRLPLVTPDGHDISEQMTLVQVRVGNKGQ
jgi:hypothetical protein